MFDANMNLSANYLYNLPVEQKVVFLRIFSKMIHFDGQVDETEKEFMRRVAAMLDVAPQKVDEALKSVDREETVREAALIKNRRVALELIKELCVLAHSDDVLSDEEILFIGEVGAAMGIEPEKIEQISNWVIDRLIWLNQGKIIFEEV